MGRRLIAESVLYEYIKDALRYRALIEHNVQDWSFYYDALDEYKSDLCARKGIDDDGADCEDYSVIGRYELFGYMPEELEHGRYEQNKRNR